MEMGMFKDEKDKTSSSRVTGFIVIMASLILIFSVIATSCYIAILQESSAPLIAGATGAGTLFVTVSGTSMFYMYNQKKTENGNIAK